MRAARACSAARSGRTKKSQYETPRSASAREDDRDGAERVTPAAAQTVKVAPWPGSLCDVDAAAVLLDDAIADREAEADVGPVVLGGEEGLEDALADLGGDALAAVVDDERDARAAPSPASVRVATRSLPPPGMAVRALATRLSSTCASWPASARARGLPSDELVDELDLLIADERLGERQRVAHQLVEIDGGAHRLFALHAEAEQVLHHRRGAARALFDVLERLVVGRGGRAIGEEELHVADDAAERIVDLVGDAGAELAERRELLRLDELRLRLLELARALGDARFELAVPALDLGAAGGQLFAHLVEGARQRAHLVVAASSGDAGVELAGAHGARGVGERARARRSGRRAKASATTERERGGGAGAGERLAAHARARGEGLGGRLLGDQRPAEARRRARRRR